MIISSFTLLGRKLKSSINESINYSSVKGLNLAFLKYSCGREVLMFLVGHGIRLREKKIIKFLRREPTIAVLLAAGHFEWTLYRAIISLGKDSNVELRNRMSKVYGLDRYKEFWREEIATESDSKPLPQIVNNWSALKEAFSLRNKLIHGRDRCTFNMAAPKVEVMLEAAEEIYNYCLSRNVDLDKRLHVRRKRKEG